MYLGFVGLLFLGSLVLPGPRVRDAEMPNGGRRTYRLNGLPLFLIVIALAMLGQLLGWFSLAALHERFIELFIAANLFAFGSAIILGFADRRSVADGAAAARRGGVLRRPFYGVQLNPTFAGVDLKMFSYRPSLIGLALINISFAAAQYETYGTISTAMVLYQVFTFVYVVNYFQFEHGMIYTRDIVAERFGWMLIWGDYVLVPFFYSIPGWYLIGAPEPMPLWAVAGLIGLYAFGFWLFRGANGQKHRFKVNPRRAIIWGKPAETLGGRLLVSGFWGVGRHLNYTGEICIYLAFTMTTGLRSPVPYLLPLWLTILLVAPRLAR